MQSSQKPSQVEQQKITRRSVSPLQKKSIYLQTSQMLNNNNNNNLRLSTYSPIQSVQLMSKEGQLLSPIRNEQMSSQTMLSPNYYAYQVLCPVQQVSYVPVLQSSQVLTNVQTTMTTTQQQQQYQQQVQQQQQQEHVQEKVIYKDRVVEIEKPVYYEKEKIVHVSAEPSQRSQVQTEIKYADNPYHLQKIKELESEVEKLKYLLQSEADSHLETKKNTAKRNGSISPQKPIIVEVEKEVIKEVEVIKTVEVQNEDLIKQLRHQLFLANQKCDEWEQKYKEIESQEVEYKVLQSRVRGDVNNQSRSTVYLNHEQERGIENALEKSGFLSHSPCGSRTNLNSENLLSPNRPTHMRGGSSTSIQFLNSLKKF